MRKRSMAIPTNIELDPAIEARFDQLVHSSGRSSAFFLQELIAHGMDDFEDIYFAGQEVERLQRGESSARPLDAVSADLGLTPRGNGSIPLPLGPGPCGFPGTPQSRYVAAGGGVGLSLNTSVKVAAMPG